MRSIVGLVQKYFSWPRPDLVAVMGKQYILTITETYGFQIPPNGQNRERLHCSYDDDDDDDDDYTEEEDD